MLPGLPDPEHHVYTINTFSIQWIIIYSIFIRKKIKCFTLNFPTIFFGGDPIRFWRILYVGGKNLFTPGFYFLPISYPAALPAQVINQEVAPAGILSIEIIAQLFDTGPVV